MDASEAEIFIWVGGTFEGLWQVRTTAGSELVSVPCAGVRSVALDPSPAMEPQRIALVSIDRKVHGVDHPRVDYAPTRKGWP